MADKPVTKFEMNFRMSKEEFKIDNKMHKYKLITPWLAINQRNYLTYINEKLNLNKVMQNNLLSNFKGLGI